MAFPVNVCTSLMDRERAGVALSECRYWTLCVCVYLPTYIGLWWVVVHISGQSYKHFAMVMFNCRVVNYNHKVSIILATGTYLGYRQIELDLNKHKKGILRTILIKAL